MKVSAWVAGLILIAGCRQLQSDAERRSSRAKGNTGELIVGVVWPLKEGENAAMTSGEADPDEHFWHGIDAAVARIEGEGGVNGRKLTLLRANDDGMVRDGKTIAQGFVENLDLVAVIGHHDPGVSTVASVMYEYGNVVMIAPGSGSERLARDGFVRVFRTLPTDEEMGRHLANYAREHALKQVLVILENDPQGRGLQNGFEARAEEHNVSIVDRITFDRGSVRGLDQALENLGGAKIDGVLIAVRLPAAADVIVTLRKAGIDAPLIGADGLDSTSLLKIPEAAGTVVATVYHPDAELPEAIAFTKTYRDLYKHDPDTWSAQGYDALILLSQAVHHADSATPEAISDALRDGDGWRGATGPLKFNARGDVLDRPVIFKRVKDGKFELVAAAVEAKKPVPTVGVQKATKNK